MAKMHITLETGTVTSVEESNGARTALVAMDPPESGEEGCATCRMCYAKDGCDRLLSAIISENKDFAIGTRVEVEIRHPSLYLPIFMTLLLPLMGIVAGGVIGLVLSSGHDAKDLISSLLAIAGGAVFFVLGQIALRKKGGMQIRHARIRRIL
jgi:positive regulator of sigma E activity